MTSAPAARTDADILRDRWKLIYLQSGWHIASRKTKLRLKIWFIPFILFAFYFAKSVTLNVHFYGVKCNFSTNQFCRCVQHCHNYSKRLIGFLCKTQVKSQGVKRGKYRRYLPFIATSVHRISATGTSAFYLWPYWKIQVLTPNSIFTSIYQAIPNIFIKSIIAFRPSHFGTQEEYPVTMVTTKQQNTNKTRVAICFFSSNLRNKYTCQLSSVAYCR